jgi:hypothetical protein
MTEFLLSHRRDSYGGEDAPVFFSEVGTELQPSNVHRRVLAPAAISVGLSEEVEGPDAKKRQRSTVSSTTSGTPARRCSSTRAATSVR